MNSLLKSNRTFCSQLRMNWSTYIQKTKDLPPHDLLIRAITYAKKGKALDFGAGGFRDTRYLLKEGFEVTALDVNAEETIDDNNFKLVSERFEDFTYPVKEYTLIDGQFAFPFIEKNNFVRIRNALHEALIDGGILTGNFVGTNDATSKGKMLFHSREEIEKLLSSYEIISFEEM